MAEKGASGRPAIQAALLRARNGQRITKRNKGETAVNKLGNSCIECGSGITDKTVERESRQFRFERINFTCGATLETFHTANGNVARAIHSGCTTTE